jgi:PAS domain S-box-containing protein
MAKTTSTPRAKPPPTDAQPSTEALLHELRVHQIELEMQNDELRQTQVELAAARDRFVDLYDFAPVGYFTLDAQGRVVEANLTGATMLGEDHGALRQQRLARFVAPSMADRWHRHLRRALQQDHSQRIDLLLRRRDGVSFHAQLDSLRVTPPAAAPMLRVTLTDISQSKQAEMDRRLAGSTVDAREAERRHVARELHEELGQRLTALKMNLASLPASADLRSQQARIVSMLEALDEAVAMVRRIASDLRPLMLDDLGLSAAIDWLARDTARRSGLDITLRMDANEPPLGERQAIALYRLLQQALIHSAARAGVSAIRILLHEQQGELTLTVENDGSAAPGPRSADAGEPSTADIALADNARLLDGHLELDDAAGGGRRIVVRVPLRQAEPASSGCAADHRGTNEGKPLPRPRRR